MQENVQDLAHQIELLKFQNLQLASSLNLISELSRSYKCLLENETLQQGAFDLIQSMSTLHDAAFGSEAVQDAIKNYNQKDR